MCRSKESTAVIEPPPMFSRSPRSATSPSGARRASRRQPSAGEPSSSSSVSVPEYDSTSSSKNRDWSLWSSFTTQATLSLSTLKKSLADNAHAYEFSEICSATGNLRDKRFASSSSWRCRLREKEVVVFQRAFRRPIGMPELQQRLAAICRSHHTSLAKLLGASISGNYIYLVYDYIPGASLAECLRNPRNPNYTVLSSWLSRMQIAADLAHGLDYIHNSIGLDIKFVHNHITSANVILTEPSLNAKICHFGTAALCGEIAEEDRKSKGVLSRSGSGVVRIEGTRGYMAPELQATGMADQRTDVYAFGVVILELLSGSEPISYREDESTGGYETESVVAGARAAAEGGRVRMWADRRLRDSFPVEVAANMTRVGLECADPDPRKRPDMNRVAGIVSRLYLESKDWSERMGVAADFSVSLAPR